jgi:hypothetical protein
MSWEDIIKRRIGRSYNLARLGVDGIRRDKVIDTFSDKNMAEKLSDEMNEMKNFIQDFMSKKRMGNMNCDRTLILAKLKDLPRVF